MKYNDKKNLTYYEIVCFFILFITLTSCKKDAPPSENDEQFLSPITGTRTEFTLDSIFLYAKQIYLWNDVLPTYNKFSPRETYATLNPQLTSFKKELFDISQFKINSSNGLPYEASNTNNPKYSYIEVTKRGSQSNMAGTVLNEMILATAIMHIDSKIIGYVALGSFPRLTDNQSHLDKIFEDLASERTEHLILDLRYNSGGYIETAEYVANLIVPNSLTGKVMYTEKFNPLLQNGRAPILKNQPYLDEKGNSVIYKGRAATLADINYSENANTYKFKKKGNLETIKDIYIIVSGQTASASELLISCLKPYFNIKLVGERTYGKPVGFFGITIDQYTVYLSSFLIENAQGWSDYFDGMLPDIFIISNSNPILGDPDELCLKAAITAISGRRDIKTSIKVSGKNIPKTTNTSIRVDTIIHGALENRWKLN